MLGYDMSWASFHVVEVMSRTDDMYLVVFKSAWVSKDHLRSELMDEWFSVRSRAQEFKDQGELRPCC